ncbi:hypothetical protein [Caballeronia sp. GAFFF2]|uniref:hypothetical protein n=1 Tax=Caballeronia sp. GAFFF2 TaxID=2921741 RepID=UPI0020298DF4|nr:hypothetical protein [Caballeronia sp. GAFFF2]
MSDWMMPVMGGEELLHRLKSSPAFCAIPVIAMSALPPVAPLPLAEILQKPFPVTGMLNAIKRVLASAPLRVDRCIDGSAM